MSATLLRPHPQVDFVVHCLITSDDENNDNNHDRDDDGTHNILLKNIFIFLQQHPMIKNDKVSPDFPRQNQKVFLCRSRKYDCNS